MKVGDLVKHRNAPPGEGRVRIVVKFGKKMYNYFDKQNSYMRATIHFADGLWDWKSDWRKLSDYEV